MDIAYNILKIYIVLIYIYDLFSINESVLILIGSIIWAPAVYAILFLNGTKQVNVLMIVLAISIFYEPVVAFLLYESVYLVLYTPFFTLAVIYFLFLYKEDYVFD